MHIFHFCIHIQKKSEKFLSENYFMSETADFFYAILN